jgi:Effector Associated Constant Component 1
MLVEPFFITFPGASMDDANRYAADLADCLKEIDQDVAVEQRRAREDTQDFGATLAIVLGTASATALARGVAAWLARHSGAKIQISTDGTVLASNLDSRDAARIAEAFSRRKS